MSPIVDLPRPSVRLTWKHGNDKGAASNSATTALGVKRWEILEVVGLHCFGLGNRDSAAGRGGGSSELTAHTPPHPKKSDMKKPKRFFLLTLMAESIGNATGAPWRRRRRMVVVGLWSKGGAASTPMPPDERRGILLSPFQTHERKGAKFRFLKRGAGRCIGKGGEGSGERKELKCLDGNFR